MCYGSPLPEGETFAGIVLDDLAVFHACDLEVLASHTGPDRDIIKQSRAAYASGRLPISENKSFGFAVPGSDSRGSEDFIAWGSQVEGRLGRVGSEWVKRAMLCKVGCGIAAIGKANPDLLRRYAGGTIRPFMHRREGMCVYHRFYKYLNATQAGGVVILPAEIRDEIAASALWHSRSPICVGIFVL